MKWGGSAGRSVGELVASLVAVTVVGTFVWALGVGALFGAAVLTGGMTKGAGAVPVAIAGAVLSLVVEACFVAAVGAATVFVLARGDAARAPRFAPALAVGLVVFAVTWASNLATPQASERVIAFVMWPSHLGSWLYVALAQVVTVNLTMRPR